MNDQSVIVVGAFHEIIELLEENCILIKGLIDNQKKGEYRGYHIFGNDGCAKTMKNGPAIITPDKPSVRLKLFELYSSFGFWFEKVISKSAKISKSSEIGEGSIIQHGVNISSAAVIGKFVKCNTYCNIMHDSKIGDFTTISPNAVVLGNVKIGKCCYIGANATILPNISIHDNVTVGAGSVVTKDIKKNKIVCGVPSK